VAAAGVRRARRRSGARLNAAALLCLSAPLPAQDKAPPPAGKDEDVKAASAVDPYTEGDAKTMAAAGVVAYGPFPWVDDKSTADIERVLGDKRILWLETAHFRIGSALPNQNLPPGQDQKRVLLDDLKQLRKKLPRVPERPGRLDPWLRLHLYAGRAEACYAWFQKLLGVTDADFGDGTVPRKGAFFGLPGKFLLLLFQKKSDLARYFDHFCDQKTDQPGRFYHARSGQMVAVLCVEGLENFDDSALHRYLVFLLAHNFMCGYQGFYYALPLWFEEGIAHWCSRKVESDFVVAKIKDNESVDKEKQNEWALKVRRRAQFDGTWIPFATMISWRKWEDMGFHAHAQSWSRIDFLMSRSPEKLGQMLKVLKNLPLPSDGTPVDKATLDAVAAKELQERFGLDDKAFDQQWREWVLKTYPKK
jgi:hypothetical protein